MKVERRRSAFRGGPSIGHLPRNKRAHGRSPFPSAPSSSLSPPLSLPSSISFYSKLAPTSNNRHPISINLNTYCQYQSTMSAEYVLVSRNEPLYEAQKYSHEPSNPPEPRHLEMVVTSHVTISGSPTAKTVLSNEKPHICFFILGPTGSGNSSFIAAAAILPENASIIGHSLDSRTSPPRPSKPNKEASTNTRFPRPRHVNLHALPLRNHLNPLHPPQHARLRRPLPRRPRDPRVHQRLPLVPRRPPHRRHPPHPQYHSQPPDRLRPAEPSHRARPVRRALRPAPRAAHHHVEPDPEPGRPRRVPAARGPAPRGGVIVVGPRGLRGRAAIRRDQGGGGVGARGDGADAAGGGHGGASGADRG